MDQHRTNSKQDEEYQKSFKNATILSWFNCIDPAQSLNHAYYISLYNMHMILVCYVVLYNQILLDL